MQKLANILKEFPNRKITVIGDIMIDKSIYGDVSRVSPEAPALILKVNNEVYELGGAANVASNIKTLGGSVSIFGFIGEDENGTKIKKMFEEKEIKYFIGNSSQTTLKIRGIGKRQQIIRFDYEETSEKIFSSELKKEMEQEINSSDIIVVSDYAKGAITEDLMNFLKKYSNKIIIGPKPKNRDLYKDAFLIVPNEEESLSMSQKKDLLSAGRDLKENLNSNILITRGAKGMMLFSDKELEIPTYAKEVFEVTGAGDTVIATVALALAIGSSLEDAAILANHAAGIAVSKFGTYSVKLSELDQAIFGEEEKVKTFEELKLIVSDLKRKGKRIVWTNGCFDILHEGHTSYLKKAKGLGSYLIVGLNSDESVRILKGEGRPKRPQEARAEILSSLQFVDYVMIFQETSVEKYLNELKPDIYAKGEDYTIETIDQKERKIIESYGGEIVFIPFIKNISTTQIIEKIKNTK